MKMNIPGSICRPPSILPSPRLRFSTDGAAECLRVPGLAAACGPNTWVLGLGEAGQQGVAVEGAGAEKGESWSAGETETAVLASAVSMDCVPGESLPRGLRRERSAG